MAFADGWVWNPQLRGLVYDAGTYLGVWPPPQPPGLPEDAADLEYLVTPLWVPLTELFADPQRYPVGDSNVFHTADGTGGDSFVWQVGADKYTPGRIGTMPPTSHLIVNWFALGFPSERRTPQPSMPPTALYDPRLADPSSIGVVFDPGGYDQGDADPGAGGTGDPPLPPPDNDTFAGAISLPGAGGAIPYTDRGATNGPGKIGGVGLWYTWVAGASENGREYVFTQALPDAPDDRTNLYLFRAKPGVTPSNYGDLDAVSSWTDYAGRTQLLTDAGVRYWLLTSHPNAAAGHETTGRLAWQTRSWSQYVEAPPLTVAARQTGINRAGIVSWNHVSGGGRYQRADGSFATGPPSDGTAGADVWPLASDGRHWEWLEDPRFPPATPPDRETLPGQGIDGQPYYAFDGARKFEVLQFWYAYGNGSDAPPPRPWAEIERNQTCFIEANVDRAVTQAHSQFVQFYEQLVDVQALTQPDPVEPTARQVDIVLTGFAGNAPDPQVLELRSLVGHRSDGWGDASLVYRPAGPSGNVNYSSTELEGLPRGTYGLADQYRTLPPGGAKSEDLIAYSWVPREQMGSMPLLTAVPWPHFPAGDTSTVPERRIPANLAVDDHGFLVVLAQLDRQRLGLMSFASSSRTENSSYPFTIDGQLEMGRVNQASFSFVTEVTARPRYRYLTGPPVPTMTVVTRIAPAMRQRARQDGLAAGTGARRGGSEPEMRQKSLRRGPGVVW